MRRWGPVAGAAFGLALMGGMASGAPSHYLAMGAGGGGVAAGAAAVLAWRGARSVSAKASFEQSLKAAVRAWNPRKREKLEGFVAESVGPTATAHALRVATLCDLLAEQLAIGPEEAAELSMAATLHVIPAVFGGDAPEEIPCVHSPWALANTANVIASAATVRASRMVGESCERWDGAGLPAALIAEETSLGARVIAAACAFDRASVAGLEAGPELVREGTGSQFDPVVIGELLHIFREPWQSRQAAA